MPAGALSLYASCISTNRLTMNVIEQALVFVPSAIQRIGIVNRTAASEAHKTIDRIDQLLSLEGFKLDMLGAENAVNLFDGLMPDDLFDEVVILESNPMDRKGLG